jgi:hypothetical protein
MVGADRGDWTGRKDLNVVALLGLAVAVLIALAAVVSTSRLVSDVLDPEQVCQRELPLAEGLAVSQVDRAWPPPLVRCQIVDRDPGEQSFRGSVSGLTTTHVALVAGLDAIVVGLAFVGGSIVWRSRRRA